MHSAHSAAAKARPILVLMRDTSLLNMVLKPSLALIALSASPDVAVPTSLCSESGLDPIRHVIIEILHDVRIRSAGASGARADAMSRSFDRDEILVDALRLAQEVLAVADEVVRAHVGYQQRLGDHSKRAWRGVIAGAPINLVVVQ